MLYRSAASPGTPLKQPAPFVGSRRARRGPLGDPSPVAAAWNEESSLAISDEDLRQFAIQWLQAAAERQRDMPDTAATAYQQESPVLPVLQPVDRRECPQDSRVSQWAPSQRTGYPDAEWRIPISAGDLQAAPAATVHLVSGDTGGTVAPPPSSASAQRVRGAELPAPPPVDEFPPLNENTRLWVPRSILKPEPVDAQPAGDGYAQFYGPRTMPAGPLPRSAPPVVCAPDELPSPSCAGSFSAHPAAVHSVSGDPTALGGYGGGYSSQPPRGASAGNGNAPYYYYPPPQASAPDAARTAAVASGPNYPGIEMLSPGYPEYEAYARQQQQRPPPQQAQRVPPPPPPPSWAQAEPQRPPRSAPPGNDFGGGYQGGGYQGGGYQGGGGYYGAPYPREPGRSAPPGGGGGGGYSGAWPDPYAPAPVQAPPPPLPRPPPPPPPSSQPALPPGLYYYDPPPQPSSPYGRGGGGGYGGAEGGYGGYSAYSYPSSSPQGDYGGTPRRGFLDPPGESSPPLYHHYVRPSSYTGPQEAQATYEQRDVAPLAPTLGLQGAHGRSGTLVIATLPRGVPEGMAGVADGSCAAAGGTAGASLCVAAMICMVLARAAQMRTAAEI